MKNKTNLWSIGLVTATSLLIQIPSNAQTVANNPQTLGISEFVRTRCSTDRKNVYIEWSGAVYAFVPQEKQRKLFNIAGMNVGRCMQDQQGQWFLTSRELNLYLDPETNQVLNRWQNPWTGEEVPVVHVANNPVQNSLNGEYPVSKDGDQVTFSLDVPLTYPNVLARDPKFQDYSPDPLYQAGEFFKFTAPFREITNASSVIAAKVSGAWHRIGPWLPWMKMKGKPGQLVYSATMQKRTNFDELSAVLKQEITSRLPLYREAPSCFLAVKNETSWTYFQKHFDEYLKGTQFPLVETESKVPCKS
jgi:Protein of unknown function (DUF1838)